MEYFMVIIVLVLGVGCGFFLGGKFGFKNRKDKIDIASTVKEILPISEYASLVYYYSSVITHSQVNQLFKLNIPLTEKKAIYTIDGTVKLGIDGKKISVTDSYKNIIIHMPKIGILSHEIYNETFRLYDEKTSIFNRYNLKEANEIQLTHKINKENEITRNSGLFTQAKESAEQQFGLLLKNLPGIKENYKIVFEWDV
jgi:hypothetical protein